MSTQTITRPTTTRRTLRNHKPLHVAPAARAGSRPRPAEKPATATETVSPAKLEEVENRLLADAIEHHANVEAALDGALDDMTVLAAELRRSRRRPLLLRSATNLHRVEDLLLQAIVRAHPNREDALDHLLADVTDDEAAVTAEARERAAFDMGVDNDFDGMA